MIFFQSAVSSIVDIRYSVAINVHIIILSTPNIIILTPNMFVKWEGKIYFGVSLVNFSNRIMTCNILDRLDSTVIRYHLSIYNVKCQL